MIQRFTIQFSLLPLATLLLMLLGSSCREPIVSQTPPQLHSLLKCKVNEVDWRSTTPLSTAYYLNNALIIRAQDSINRIIDLRFGMPNGLQTGDYQLSPSTASGGFVATYVAPNGFDIYKTANPSQGSGLLSLQYVDPVNKVISGRFYFKGVNAANGDTVAIRDGEFTMNYKLYYENVHLSMGWQIKTDIWNNIPGPTASDNGLNVIYLIGQDTTKTVSLAFPEYVIPGTYTYPFPSNRLYGEYAPVSTYKIAADSGTITVDVHNVIKRELKGSFNLRFFDAVNNDTVRILNGHFDSVYQ